MQTLNPAVEQNKNITWCEFPWNQSGGKGVVSEMNGERDALTVVPSHIPVSDT